MRAPLGSTYVLIATLALAMGMLAPFNAHAGAASQDSLWKLWLRSKAG